jgi:hypothetical protein
LAAFIEGLKPGQTTIAIQSHTHTPIEVIRKVALGWKA